MPSGDLLILPDTELCELCSDWIDAGGLAVVFEDGHVCLDCFEDWSC